MKRLLVSGSALAVLSVIAFGLMPSSAAGAATARETFRQMRTALTTAKKKMKVLVQVEMSPDNQANVTVTQDGKKVTPPMTVKADVHREGNKVTVFATVSFQESDYSKIAYGKNRNTLVLWPKAQPTCKHEVALDGKSKLPVSWATFAKADKAWRKVGAYRFQYSPKA